MRRYVDQVMGYTTYNALSQQVAQAKWTRLRRFTRHFEAYGASELEHVPDAHLLAVLHVHGSLDGGEFDAIGRVLERRNACAHPGRYSPGFHSCLSALEDIEQIVILNPRLT